MKGNGVISKYKCGKKVCNIGTWGFKVKWDW